MTPVAIRTPLLDGDTVELAKGGRYFWKDVLRTGSIDYKGRRLDFTPDYLDGLITAHREGAFDSVPLVFAAADNAHTQDVERIRGDILGFRRDGDRLRALVHASTDEAADLLRNNPKIGCSVRIEHPIARADGKTWQAGVQHVLATANPRINGLGPWEPVELGSDDRPVIDLSTYDFADDGDGTDSADHPEEDEMPDAPSPQLTADELAQFRALLAAQHGQDTPVEQPAQPGEPTDTELEEIAAALLAEDDPADTPAMAGAGAELSADAREAIELAQTRADRLEIELAQLRERDQQNSYERLRDELAADGIPPRITELAKPLLHGTHTVELANGDDVDAGQIVLSVMRELAAAKLVDLSAGDTVYDADAHAKARAADESRTAEMAAYRTQFGL